MHIDDVNTFYGSATLARVRNMDKLGQAVRQFNIAAKASTPGIMDRALNLAAKNEAAAFEVAA